MPLTTIDNLSDLQKQLTEVARAGKRVALVPTMGALHAGHMALVEVAKKHADVVVVSIFVNPAQFGPGEDFEKYPRQTEQDVEKLRLAGVELLYAPSMEDVYPQGFATTVSMGEMGQILDGKFRPGHFNGVATVVTKLLLRVLPHVAVFGEKDYQQLCIVRQLVSDLDIPIEIIGVPTIREEDGLALSSRNAYLSQEERATAPKLQQILKSTAQSIQNGADMTSACTGAMAQLMAAGFKPDYVELRQADTLFMLDTFEKPARLLVAAWLGNTRLIDNIAVG
jgi:pantoate--beta-alanine ligase